MHPRNLANNTSAFLKKVMRAAGLMSDINQAIAHLSNSYVRDHEHFSWLLTEMEPDHRQEMYDAMRPHLKFQAWPFDRYIIYAQQKAEREKLPILSSSGKLLEFRSAQDVSTGMKQAQAILDKELADRTLIVVCGKCTARDTFYGHKGQTKVDVILKARRAGWIYDGTIKDKQPMEICPTCETPLRAPHEAHYGKPVKIVNG